MAEDRPEIRADSRWLTYEEAAARLGIKPESVARLARMKRWPRQAGNDGKVRVAIPAEALPESRLDSGEERRRRRRADSGEESALSKALQAAAEARGEARALRERAERAEAAAAEVPGLRERAARAEGEAAALRTQAEREVQAREEAQRAAEEARANLDAWRRAPWWKRALLRRS